MAPARHPITAAQKQKNDEGKQWWFGIFVLGSLCIQCFILSVHSKLRQAIVNDAKSSLPDDIPSGQIHRANAALAFAVLSWSTCFFNFYAILTTRSMVTYSQQRGFMLNLFPIFWGLLTLAVSTAPGYRLPNCLASYCRVNDHIRHVWEVQLGHCILQACYFLLFITQFPFQRPSPALDSSAVIRDVNPVGRSDEPLSLDDARLATVPTTLRDHLNLFFVASTAPFWVFIEFTWFWTSVCIPNPPAGQRGVKLGTPIRSPHVSNEFYCWWYVTCVWGVSTTSPFVKYIVNPLKVGCFNCFWNIRWAAFKRKIDKATEKEENNSTGDGSGGNIEKMAEEGRIFKSNSNVVRVPSPRVPKHMELPRVSVGNWPMAAGVENTELQRHEMDATPSVSEVEGSNVPTVPTRVYAPRQYHPAPVSGVSSAGSPTSQISNNTYNVRPTQTY